MNSVDRAALSTPRLHEGTLYLIPTSSLVFPKFNGDSGAGRASFRVCLGGGDQWWSVGAVFMIILGVGSVAIGLTLPMYEYAILGVILVVAGILLLVSLRQARSSRLRDG